MNKSTSSTPVMVPMLYLKDVNAGIKFYENALPAKTRWKISHEGRTHVAEMEIDGTLLRLHEEQNATAAESRKGSWIEIHLLVEDPDAMMERATLHGAVVLSPMQDHDYGFRQGNFMDPFGFQWCLERKGDLYKIPRPPAN